MARGPVFGAHDNADTRPGATVERNAYRCNVADAHMDTHCCNVHRYAMVEATVYNAARYTGNAATAEQPPTTDSPPAATPDLVQPHLSPQSSLVAARLLRTGKETDDGRLSPGRWRVRMPG